MREPSNRCSGENGQGRDTHVHVNGQAGEGLVSTVHW